MKRIVFIVIITIGLFTLSSCNNIKEAKKITNDFYISRQNKDYNKMFSLFSTQVFEHSSKEDILEELVLVEQKFGKIKSYTSTGFEIKTENGITKARFEYKVVFEKGKTKDEIILQKTGDSFKIFYYNWVVK